MNIGSAIPLDSLIITIYLLEDILYHQGLFNKIYLLQTSPADVDGCFDFLPCPARTSYVEYEFMTSFVFA